MGRNLFITDLVAIKLMGFDYKKIPLIKNALSMENFPIYDKNTINDINIISNNKNLHDLKYIDIKLIFNFIPHI